MACAVADSLAYNVAQNFNRIKQDLDDDDDH
jgi:hypothetical protein